MPIFYGIEDTSHKNTTTAITDDDDVVIEKAQLFCRFSLGPQVAIVEEIFCLTIVYEPHAIRS
jgi:hypothetical protein